MKKEDAPAIDFKLHYELLLALPVDTVPLDAAEALLAVLGENIALSTANIWQQSSNDFSLMATSGLVPNFSIEAHLPLITQNLVPPKNILFGDLAPLNTLPFDQYSIFILLENFGLLYLQTEPTQVSNKAYWESLLPAFAQWSKRLSQSTQVSKNSSIKNGPIQKSSASKKELDFQEILTLSGIGTFEYSPKEKRINLSAKATEIFGAGHSKKEISFDQYIQDFVPKHTQKEVQEHIEKAIAENKVLDLDTRLKKKDGETFYANIKLTTKSEDGNTDLAYGSVKDITEQYRYIKNLRTSENNLIEAQSLAKLGSYDYDIKKDKITWSAETFKIFGMDPNSTEPTYEEYRAKLIHPDDVNAFYKRVDRVYSHGESFEIESRQLKVDGTIIHTINTGKGILNNGEISRIVGTTQDITERKLAEQKALESSQKYTQLFNNLYDAVVITDMEGRMVGSNKSAQKMLGYTEEELTQMLIADIVHPDDMEKSQKYLERLVSDGYYSDYQGRILRKDGQIVYIQVNSNAIYENGELAGSRDIVRDITELKKAEQKREELLKELEQVNQELRDFAYVVSHDLKAPLRAISSLSQWLHEDYQDKLGPEGAEQLKLLINRSNRMHNFIEAILEYSRIGRIQLHEEWVDLSMLIEEIEDTLVLPDHMAIQIPKKLPSFYGQKVRLLQVFQNLIGNAIKYNDKAQGRIYIEWEDLDSHLKFSISDNGPGIDRKYHDKIFKIFQTLQSRDHIESTGIGLTIVKRVVQLYGGEIKVSSVLGQSTTFEFTLKKL